MKAESKCNVCALFENGMCKNSYQAIQQPVYNCAAQILTEEGWMNLGYVVFENGDKIKIQ